MAKAALHLLVEITIHDGQLDAFRGIAKEMIAGSQAEPGTLGYDFYLSGDGKQCRLLQSYASADTLLTHLHGPVVQQLVPKTLQCVTVDRFSVYGDPGSQAAATLANFSAQAFGYWGGLNR